MARARNIKPGFFANEVLAELDPLARILFAGLWTIADREGRLEDRPKRIKRDILPYDVCDIETLLDQLFIKDFIIRYEVNSKKYIQIINFLKHQNPHKNEIPSVIPEYTGKGASGSIQIESDTDFIGTTPADSLNLIPDSLNLIPDSLNLIPDSLTLDSFNHIVPQGTDDKNDVRMERFRQFWSAYPKKRSKGDAEKAWNKIKPDELLHNRILQSLEQAKTSVDWTKNNGQYIPYPASWLNAKGWEDELEPERKQEDTRKIVRSAEDVSRLRE